MPKESPLFYKIDAKHPENKERQKIIEKIIERYGSELAINYGMSLFFALEEPDITSEIYSPNVWAKNEYAFSDKAGRVLVSNIATKELSDLAYEGLCFKSLSYYHVIAHAEKENPEIFKGIIKKTIAPISIDIGSEISGARKFPQEPMARFRNESWNYEFRQGTLKKEYVSLALDSFANALPLYAEKILKGINFSFK